MSKNSALDRSLNLRVGEAATKDVGRAFARLDPDDMKRLGVETGDVVEIRVLSENQQGHSPGGNAGEAPSENLAVQVAVAKVMPSHPVMRGNSRVALDGLTRENAGAGVDDLVRVNAAQARVAERVEISALGLEPTRRDLDHIGRLLDGLVLREGARLRATVFGSRSAEFVVKLTVPKGNVILHPLSQLTVRPNSPATAAGASLNGKAGSERSLRYEDVGGLKPQLQRIREMIEMPLRHPELFAHLGIAPPKGVLLYGPPGTGKTLIARAIAQESKSRFYSVSGPEIIHKHYGESEAQLRRIFEDAGKNGPSIIFLDEIDSIAPRRERVSGDVEKRVVAQLLTLMDGLKRRSNVVVIAATNLPDAIDPALRRPGRFDREIEIPIPDRIGRQEILEIHSNGMPIASDVSMDSFAARTHGFVGADLESLCREAAMRCLRRLVPDWVLSGSKHLEKLLISSADFEEALVEIEPSAMRDVSVDIPNVRWEDVGGLSAIRQRLIEIVIWPIRRPDLFRQSGVRPPKGLLLSGPPGCGKTLLAKAIATEGEVNFISVKGPELLSKFVGESEQAIREIFRKARRAAPCILFFDEFDSVALARGQGQDPVADRVLTQVLTEMDGIEDLNGVFVLAASNRPDRLDPAILRPGRLDEWVEIALPDRAGRLEILNIQLRNKQLSSDVQLSDFVEPTEGWSGAQLMNLAERAAMRGLRRAWDGGPVELRHEDLVQALAELVAGSLPIVANRSLALASKGDIIS